MQVFQYLLLGGAAQAAISLAGGVGFGSFRLGGAPCLPLRLQRRCLLLRGGLLQTLRFKR